MVSTLIKILKLNSENTLCESVQCSDTECAKCPFNSKEQYLNLINELTCLSEKSRTMK